MMAVFTGSFSLGLFGRVRRCSATVASYAGYPAVFAVAAVGTLAAVRVLSRSSALQAAGNQL